MKTDTNLRDEVIHGLKSPYIRMSDIKFRDKKTQTKKLANKLSREISAGTHYYLTHEFLDILLPSLKKLSIRHFVNAFHNAMPPHKSFFIEWDGKYVNDYVKDTQPCYSAKGLNLELSDLINDDNMQVNFGVSSTYARPNVVSYEDKKPYPRSSIDYRFDGRKDTHIPEGQKLSFFASVNIKDSIGEEEQQRYARAAELHQKNNTKRLCMSSQSMILFGLENNTSEKYFRDVSEKLPDNHQLFMTWFDVKTFSDFMSSGLSDAINLLRIFPHEGVDYLHYSQGDVLSSFSGYEFYSLMIYVGAVSLLNYDWVVNEEDGVIARGTKSVNTEAFPQDRYKRVTINLPKDKAIKLYNKQKARTRKFGTAEHTVRGHWRVYKKTGERVWIGEHSRGDAKYGTVHKDYTLTKRGNYLKANKKKVA